MSVSTPRLCFVGVTTGGSSIMSLFPRWAAILGIDAAVVGRDIPLGAPPGAYRECIRDLEADETISGALVTTHKTAVFDHAAGLFARLDESAVLCREVSCIARRPEGLVGWAKDPTTAGLALDHLLGADHWRESEGDVVCLGAGGAGLAIMVRAVSEPVPPRRVVLVDRDEQRLALAAEVYGELETESEFVTLLHTSVAANDGLVSDSPPGSLIINATGMGKDVPGAPISRNAVFPRGSIAWDLNYRGDLEFLRLAHAQASERDMQVADGWRYFLHGWTEVIAEVFELELTPKLFDELASVAGATASPASTELEASR